MSMTLLVPLAFAGLALVAVPIAIHVLTRHERRPMPFPSLRFLRTTRLSALSRRRIDDWPLLLLRLAAVVGAVAALAGPLFVTTARERQWASRVSRVLVVVTPAPMLDEERRTAFASTTIEAGGRMADAIDAAQSWLNRQPPSAREVVIAGDLRVSMLTASDVARIPDEVGVRFLPSTDGDVVKNVAVPVIRNDESGAAAADLVPVLLDDDSTATLATRPAPSADIDANALVVLSAPADRAVAEAALRAVRSDLIVRDQAARRRVVIAWPGADVSALGPPVTPPTLDWIPGAVERLARPARQHIQSLLVQLETRPIDARAAVEVADIARAVFADARTALEPRRLSAAELARWSRPPGRPGPEQPRQDEGDRRWLWGIVLALLAVEHLVRSRRGRSSQTSDVSPQEAHVA